MTDYQHTDDDDPGLDQPMERDPSTTSPWSTGGFDAAVERLLDSVAPLEEFIEDPEDVERRLREHNRMVWAMAADLLDPPEREGPRR